MKTGALGHLLLQEKFGDIVKHADKQEQEYTVNLVVRH